MINITIYKNYKKISILYLICFIFLYWQLISAKNIPIDLIIVIPMQFCMTINNIFIFQIINRNKIMNQIQNYILLRINKESYTNTLIKIAILDTIINIIVIYIFPILIFHNNIQSYRLYFLFVLIISLIFFIYEMIITTTLFIKNTLIKFILYTIPFIANIIIQLYYFQNFY